MSRQIKFRVWDKQYKCWITQSSSDWTGFGIGNVGGSDTQPCRCMTFDGKIMSNDNMGGFVDHNQENYAIQQYTGLKDKNGKEIYEGDILHLDRFTDWVVVYDDASFKVKNVHNHPLYHVSKYECLDREIIGNIFENADLLK